MEVSSNGDEGGGADGGEASGSGARGGCEGGRGPSLGIAGGKAGKGAVCGGGEGGSAGGGGEGGGGEGGGGVGGRGVGGGGLGGDGDGVSDGGDGDWNGTTNDPVPWLPLAKEQVCPEKPGADHSAPFQPSPHVSRTTQLPCASRTTHLPRIMSRVHVAPSATANGTLEAYGAPPLSVVPSEQLRLQPTSVGYDPLEQVIAEEIVGATGGVGGGGAKGGGAMGGAAARSTGSHCGGWATPRSSEGSVFERRWPMACPCADSSVRLAKGAATPMRTRLRKLRDCLAWSFGGQV